MSGPSQFKPVLFKGQLCLQMLHVELSEREDRDGGEEDLVVSSVGPQHSRSGQELPQRRQKEHSGGRRKANRELLLRSQNLFKTPNCCMRQQCHNPSFTGRETDLEQLNSIGPSHAARNKWWSQDLKSGISIQSSPSSPLLLPEFTSVATPSCNFSQGQRTVLLRVTLSWVDTQFSVHVLYFILASRPRINSTCFKY